MPKFALAFSASCILGFSIAFLINSDQWKSKSILEQSKSVSPSTKQDNSLDREIYRSGKYFVTQGDVEDALTRLSSEALTGDALPLNEQNYDNDAKQMVTEKLVIQVALSDFFDKNLTRYPTIVSEQWKHCESSISTDQSQKYQPKHSSHEIRHQARTCRQRVLEQFLETLAVTQLQEKEKELLAHYDAISPISEENKMQVLVRQIVLSSEKQARRLKRQLTKGNFQIMAKKHSIYPPATEDGIIGPYAYGELPAVFDQAFTLKKHEISDIYKSQYGFHIFILLDKYDINPIYAQPDGKPSWKDFQQKEKTRIKSEWIANALKKTIPFRY